MKDLRHLLLLILLPVVSWGCRDDLVEPQRDSEAEVFPATTESVSGEPGHHARASRYDIRLNAAGAFRPNAAIEGAVAAFLWDLTDPFDADEPWDTMEFPVSFIADLWAGCHVQAPNGSVRQADGIDDIIYCLEREVDPEVRNHEYFFATRPDLEDAVAIAQMPPSPAGWSRDGVRTIWITDLHSLEQGEAGPDPIDPPDDPGGGGGGECEKEPIIPCP